MIVARSMAAALAVVVVGFSAVVAAEPAKGDKEPDVVSYYQHVRPIFVHSLPGLPSARQAGRRLSS